MDQNPAPMPNPSGLQIPSGMHSSPAMTSTGDMSTHGGPYGKTQRMRGSKKGNHCTSCHPLWKGVILILFTTVKVKLLYILWVYVQQFKMKLVN